MLGVGLGTWIYMKTFKETMRQQTAIVLAGIGGVLVFIITLVTLNRFLPS